MTNPLNLNYRFQTDGISRREAADPVIIFYQGHYYLFGSHASGYWYSDNLRDWEYICTRTLKAVESWAPAVFVYKDAVYYLGMGARMEEHIRRFDMQRLRVCRPGPEK